MALILAINPGNSHSPTLARLARELKGCELIGAESCAIALTAMKERVPTLVLLPDRTPRGEPELLARLRGVPGGVPTLRLPPVNSADPPALVKEIRALLEAAKHAPPASSRQTPPHPPPRPARPAAARPAAPAKPAGPSPQLVAAAKATIEWAHARRAQWAEIDQLARRPISTPVAAAATGGAHEVVSSRIFDADKPAILAADEPFEPREPALDDMDAAPARSRARIWLPRVAVMAVLVGGGWAGVTFYSRDGGRTSTGVRLDTVPEPAPERMETTEAPAESAPLSNSAEVPPAAMAADSGWIAVAAPFDVSITSAKEPVPLDATGRGTLAPGKYRLRLQNAAIGFDETHTIEVRQSETTAIDVAAQTAITVSASETAEVLIDEKPVGETPFKGRLPFGPHVVTVRTTSGAREFKLDATMKPVRLEVDFTRPQP